MKTTWPALALFIALMTSACLSSGSLWRHPATQDEQRCVAQGWGWLGTPLAAVAYADCKDDLEKRGYVKVRSLGQKEVFSAVSEAELLNLAPECAARRPHDPVAYDECLQALHACSSHHEPIAYGACINAVRTRWK